MPAIKRSNLKNEGVSVWAWVFLALMVVVVVGAVLLVFGIKKSELTERISSTWVVLQSEKMSFLTTQRQEWQARIGSTRGAWYGVEESQGTVAADVFYGFDMSSLTQDDVTLDADGTVVIKFPPVQILTVSLKPETYEAVTKRTGLMKLKTMIEDSDAEVQKRLGSLKREVLMDMFQHQKLDFKELEKGIMNFLDPIFQKQGIPYRIEFQDDSPNRAILRYMRQENFAVLTLMRTEEIA